MTSVILLRKQRSSCVITFALDKTFRSANGMAFSYATTEWLFVLRVQELNKDCEISSGAVNN